jgi:DNA-binding transcriptional LysR family regulator
MLDLNDLYYFVRVVDSKGYAAAGRALDVPKSSLSRRVLKLEQSLGVRLIQRTSRRFVVTEVGEEFYQHCRAMLVEAEEAESAVRRRVAEPVGRVRFSAPAALGQHVIAELLPRFMVSHPKVQVIARLASAQPDLIDDGFDLALRVHARPLADSSLIQRTVCRVPLVLVAAPALLEKLGARATPGELDGCPGLARDIYIENPVWDLVHRHGGERCQLRFRPLLASNDWTVLSRSARAGVGIAAVPAHVCKHDLDTGALQRVLPQWRADEATLSILMPSRRGVLPAVRAFVEFLVAEIPALVDID